LTACRKRSTSATERWPCSRHCRPRACTSARHGWLRPSQLADAGQQWELLRHNSDAARGRRGSVWLWHGFRNHSRGHADHAAHFRQDGRGLSVCRARASHRRKPLRDNFQWGDLAIKSKSIRLTKALTTFRLSCPTRILSSEASPTARTRLPPRARIYRFEWKRGIPAFSKSPQREWRPSWPSEEGELTSSLARGQKARPTYTGWEIDSSNFLFPIGPN
jgi:hypothetical protein